jgi:hypothetical protein
MAKECFGMDDSFNRWTINYGDFGDALKDPLKT